MVERERSAVAQGEQRRTGDIHDQGQQLLHGLALREVWERHESNGLLLRASPLLHTSHSLFCLALREWLYQIQARSSLPAGGSKLAQIGVFLFLEVDSAFRFYSTWECAFTIGHLPPDRSRPLNRCWLLHSFSFDRISYFPYSSIHASLITSLTRFVLRDWLYRT